MEYKVVIEREETADGLMWYAYYPDFPGVSGGGETKTEALEIADRNLCDMIAHYQKIGHALPDVKDYSGNFIVRTTKDLHKKLAEYTKAQGSSLNSVVNILIAEGLAVKRSAEHYQSKN